MKMIQKLILLPLLSFVSLNAANSAGIISSTVQIYTGALILNEAILDFGSMYPGDTSIVASSNSCSTMYNDATVGRVRLEGVTNGENLTLKTTLPTELLHTDGITTIPVNIKDWWCQGTANSSELINSNKAVLGRTVSATTNLINFTGDITASAIQKPGIYNADINIEVIY